MMENNTKPLVKNAASAHQVNNAKINSKLSRDSELNDLRQVLSTHQGRRVMWRLLGFCKPYSTIWEPSAKIHYNAGKQDVGHFIMAEIVEADQDKYFEMMKEAKEENDKK